MPRNNARALGLIAALIPAIGTATAVPRMDLTELVRSSESIVQARVIRHWSAWDAGHRFIWTHYEIQVEDRLKGSPSAVVISEPGGTVDGIAMKMAGVPEHRDGEDMVVFLHRTPIGYWRCYGLAQGKFAVERAASGQRRVRVNLAGVERAEPALRRLAARSTGRAIESLDRMALDDFKRLVRREAARK